jgi:hypothetical protein
MEQLMILTNVDIMFMIENKLITLDEALKLTPKQAKVATSYFREQVIQEEKGYQIKRFTKLNDTQCDNAALFCVRFLLKKEHITFDNVREMTAIAGVIMSNGFYFDLLKQDPTLFFILQKVSDRFFNEAHILFHDPITQFIAGHPRERLPLVLNLIARMPNIHRDDHGICDLVKRSEVDIENVRQDSLDSWANIFSKRMMNIFNDTPIQICHIRQGEDTQSTDTLLLLRTDIDAIASSHQLGSLMNLVIKYFLLDIKRTLNSEFKADDMPKVYKNMVQIIQDAAVSNGAMTRYKWKDVLSKVIECARSVLDALPEESFVERSKAKRSRFAPGAATQFVARHNRDSPEGMREFCEKILGMGGVNPVALVPRVLSSGSSSGPFRRM